MYDHKNDPNYVKVEAFLNETKEDVDRRNDETRNNYDMKFVPKSIDRKIIDINDIDKGDIINLAFNYSTEGKTGTVNIQVIVQNIDNFNVYYTDDGVINCDEIPSTVTEIYKKHDNYYYLYWSKS